MWFLPTFGRPERCQATLDSIAAAGSSDGIVIVDGDPSYGYLKLPPGWYQVFLDRNLGLCGVLNYALENWPGLDWYGFLTDDCLVRTGDFTEPLVAAAGRNGFANSADGWQAHRRAHGALVFGGDMLRALGFWVPPGLRHCFCDDFWEAIGHACQNWRYVPEVMVEHVHVGNGKAAIDATYRKNYASMDADASAWAAIKRGTLPAAIDRVKALRRPADVDDAVAARMARARARSVMIATPINRTPAYQYTLALAETVLLLERMGIAHGRIFQIGSTNLPKARNELVARFLASGMTDLLFIDDDMGWDANAVVRLLASPPPVAGCVGRMRIDKPVTDPAVWCGQASVGVDGELTFDDMGFVKFDRVGTGFLKISREAFDKLTAAHPEWRARGTSTMHPKARENYHRFFRYGEDELEMGEDYWFCAAWRDLGGEIWVDVAQNLQHVGDKAYEGRYADMIVTQQQREAAE